MLLLPYISSTDEQMLHKMITFSATTKFSDVLVLPIKVWFMPLKKKKRNFETMKQVCGSDQEHSLKFPLSSHKQERPLRFHQCNRCTNRREGPATLPIFHWKIILLQIQLSSSCQMCFLSHMEVPVFEPLIKSLRK